jgi:Cdc6-like AAA superfamily ATPase
VTFESYKEDDITRILKARIGSSVVDSAALEYIAKNVGNHSGDARKALEMTSTAIQLCLETTKEGVESGGSLVKISHVIKAVKQRQREGNCTEIINGTPIMGKILLSIVAVLAKAKSKTTTLGKLKEFVQECLNRTNRMSELLETDDFLLMLESLVDNKLLSTGNTSSKTRLSLAAVSELMQMPILLLVPLEDVETALTDEIEGREFYERLRDHAKVLAADN